MVSRNEQKSLVGPDPTLPTNISPSAKVQALVELIDHCTEAQKVAETNEEKFLAYMLAMTIQEAQSVLRRRHLDSSGWS